MSESTNRALRGGARALTGIVVIAVAATLAVVLGAATLPTVDRDPVAITVDATHGAERSFVCAGAFAELGADSSRPSVSVPRGSTEVVTAGSEARSTDLTREESGGSDPSALWVKPNEPFAAAQSQEVVTDSLNGLAASACTEPSNEQWLVGGATSLGVSTVVVLSNPARVPATAQITVFDDDGAVDAAVTSGVLVPAGSQRVVSLNGYTPGLDRLVVRVESTGAAVTAVLGIGHVAGLLPFAVDTVTRQLAPQTHLVVPGVTSFGGAATGPNDAEDLNRAPVIVRVLSPSGTAGTAHIRALSSDGGTTDLGSIEVSAGGVSDLIVKEWPENAHALSIDSDVPVVAGALAQVTNGDAHDYAWFAPAPEIPTDDEVTVAVVDGAQLVFANRGTDPAEVTVTGGDSKRDTVTVPAGASLAISAPSDSRIVSTRPIHAAVRLEASSAIAGYPVLTESARAKTWTVYTR